MKKIIGLFELFAVFWLFSISDLINKMLSKKNYLYFIIDANWLEKNWYIFENFKIKFIYGNKFTIIVVSAITKCAR